MKGKNVRINGVRMTHEVYSAFPCISFRNINSAILINVRMSISCKLSARYQFSFLNLAQGKHFLSVKTQFLRRVLSNFDHLYCKAEVFFRFTASKGIIFFLKMSYSNLKRAYKMPNIPKASLTSDWWKNSVTSLLIDNRLIRLTRGDLSRDLTLTSLVDKEINRHVSLLLRWRVL